MVKFLSDPLDSTFAALADPTRRAILDRLTRADEITIGEIAEPFGITLPAVMKHLGVLVDAGLVTRTKVGRTVYCRLSPRPLATASQWLDHYERFWSERLDALDRYLEDQTCPPPTPVPRPTRASPSSGPTAPNPRRSTRRGRGRKP